MDFNQQIFNSQLKFKTVEIQHKLLTQIHIKLVTNFYFQFLQT